MLKKLDFYILRKFLGTFFFIIAVFILIAVVFDISEKIDDFLQEDITLREIVIDYYLSFIPWIYSTLAPLLVFIAVILFTSKMAAQTEIIPILSAGISFNRMLRPYFVGAFILLFISLFMSHFVIPKTNKNKIEFEQKIYFGRYDFNNANLYKEIKPNHYIFVKTFSKSANIAYDFKYDIIEKGELKYRFSANNIKWDENKRSWLCKNWHERIAENGKLTLHQGSLRDTVFGFDNLEFHKQKRMITTMNSIELSQYIDEEKAKGSQYTKNYEMEMIKRTAIPFSIIILTFIGVCIASKKSKGGTGADIAYGLGLASSYVFLGKVGEVFAVNTPIPTELAIWIPNIIYAIIAIFIYRLAPK
ncbi:MAG: lipopolysaccharide export system permease protein [Glaciecola sp.]|jgi:lipopolysaccharide export system permease protein